MYHIVHGMFHLYTDNKVVRKISDLSKHDNATFIYKKYPEFEERVSFYKNCEVKPFFFYIPYFQDKILRDCGGAFEDDTRINLNIVREPKPPTIISDPVFYLDDAWGGNFHHWFWEYAPKIVRFLKLKEHIPNLKLLVNLKILSQDELKQMLGRYADDVIYMDPYLEQSYSCHQLYIANPTSCWKSGYFAEDIRVELFKLFIDAFYDPSYEWTHNKVYISRYQNCLVHNATRKVLNILEVHRFFEHFGYKPVFTDKITFRDRVNIFQRVTHICCEHGGGANHIFLTKEKVKMGIINFPNLEFNDHWLQYGKFNRDIIQLENIGQYMEDRFVCKYPTVEPINYKIQDASKPWCLDLYQLETALKRYAFL